MKLHHCWMVLIVLAAACARMGGPRPAAIASAPRAPSPWLRNPRRIEGELVVEITNIQPFSGARLAADNSVLGLPPDKSPELLVWASQIVERIAQRDVEILDVTPAPTSQYTDPMNGNRILFWNLTGELRPGGSITLRRRFAYTCWEVAYEIDPEKVGPYDTESDLYRFYTKSERLIEVDDEMRLLARQICGDETNPYLKARLIFGWICDNVSYKYPPPERGAKALLHTRQGDCGQYSFLFCALCRAAGVPARFVGGFWFAEKTGYHAWAEFYLPGYGWVPADPSRADKGKGEIDWYYLGHLENTRLIASKGTNIPIRPYVHWATWQNSDINHDLTDFMQVWTEAHTGCEFNSRTRLHVISHELLPGE